MKLRKQIKKISKYSGSPDLPWEVYRVFPNIDICSTGVAFSEEGDYVNIEEAIYALDYLINELS